MKLEVGPVCRGRMHPRRWRSPNLRPTRVHPSLAYTKNVLSSLKTTERHSTVQSTLSRHQGSRAWRCFGLSGSLTRGTYDLIHNWPCWHNRCKMCPDFFPGCYSGGHRCSHNASILTCVCTMRPPESGLRVWECRHTTDILYPHLQQSAICPSSFPQVYNVTPFEWLKFLISSTNASAGLGCTLEWMLRTLFTSQSTTVTACRVKTEGTKTGSWALSNCRWPWQMNH